jgi:uncharacterized BrkB/YihY/UPF0761 family membrane protein
MKALFDALNVVYGEEERRSFLKLNAVSLAFTLGALLFMVFALAAIAVLPVVMGYLTQLAQSDLQLASRFVAAPESNQAVGCVREPDLSM